MQRLLFLILLISTSISAYATHNRAGEITYRHVSGLTYEVTITTCTKSSVEADRQFLSIDWGDLITGQTLDSLERANIIYFDDLDAQQNIYVGFHTYSGPGSFILSVLDQNRNGGVLNIPGSIDTPICFTTELIINPELAPNNSVIILNPPKALACLNRIWVYNPGGFDIDGDILKYSLIHCKGINCLPIPGYQYPDDFTINPNDTFVIDENSGTVIWDTASQTGEYNIAILIEEFREVNGQLVKVGSVTRDMQIDVDLCDNNPPIVTALTDTCIMINQELQFTVTTSDPDGDPVTVEAIGGPLTQVMNQATFNSVTNQFTWNPDCEEVQPQTYQVLFVATDINQQNNLQGIAVTNIQVIAPAVENPNAFPNGNNIDISWEPNICLSNYNDNEYDDFNYKIYRKIDLFGFVPDYCETGVPAYTGYELIATVNGLDATNYTDNNYINYGSTYCYMVVTCWPNGAESIASEEVCATINKVSPVMTEVSVVATSIEGINSIKWSPPSDIDTTIFLPPYQYKLYWIADIQTPDELIYESSLGANLNWDDTAFIHNNVNTMIRNNTYHVEFYSAGELVITSNFASSIFLTITPDDNQLTLQIHKQVPWTNSSYEVYRLIGADYELIGTTNNEIYVDTGLINQVEYCYYAKSIGSYNAPNVLDPIINLSEVVCAKPVDLTPPCPPVLTIEDYCEEEYADISWTNPNEECVDTDDVTMYNLYYSPTLEGEPELLTSLTESTVTSFILNENGELGTIAGCFYITALDSIATGLDGELHQNESEPSNLICIDNCPEYELPNIFTPNQDGINDFFIPFPYLYVDSVDFQIFNRWGNLVFETTDPDLNWDGRNKETDNLSADGTYYYTILIFKITLEGIIEEKRSGYFRLHAGDLQQKP